MKVKTARYSPEPDYFNQVHYKYLNKITSILNPIQKSLSFPEGKYPCVIVCGLKGEQGKKIVDFVKDNKPEVLILVGDVDLSLQEDLQRLNLFRLFKVKNEQTLKLFFLMHGKFLAGCSLLLCGDPLYKDVYSHISKTLYLNYSTLGFFDDIMFGLNHSLKNLDKKFIFNITKCKNCVVVGHGPSLINDIDTLKGLQGKVPIISCGSSLDSLYANNIVPDFEVLLERTPNMEAVFKGLPDEYLNKITLISTELLADFPKIKSFKEVLLFCKADELFTGISPLDIQRISSINPLVGNFGLQFGQKLAENVYLFGVDNGSKSVIGHCESSRFYDKKNGDFNLRILGNFGQIVNTNWLYKLSIDQMQNSIKGNVFNCSDGALIKGAKPTRIKDLPKDMGFRIETDFIDCSDDVKEVCIKLLKECRTLHYSLQKDLEILLQNMDKETVIRKLVVISEKIYNSGYFNRKVLNGLQSFFIEVITSMYTLPLENDNLALARFCIENTLEFLKECTSLLQKYSKLEFREY